MPLLLCTYFVAIFDDQKQRKKGHQKVLRIKRNFFGNLFLNNFSADILGPAVPVPPLALFDVSAAFDTVDHEILLKRLNVSFGFSGTLLLCMRSFLTEPSLCVVYGFSRSS